MVLIDFNDNIFHSVNKYTLVTKKKRRNEAKHDDIVGYQGFKKSYQFKKKDTRKTRHERLPPSS